MCFNPRMSQHNWGIVEYDIEDLLLCGERRGEQVQDRLSLAPRVLAIYTQSRPNLIIPGTLRSLG